MEDIIATNTKHMQNTSAKKKLDTVHSFVSADDVAAITCPACKTTRYVPIAKYKNNRHTIKVRCGCKHPFIVHLDFRQYYRKQTNLEGDYTMLPPAIGRGRLIIMNLSKNGVGFLIGAKILGKHAIKPEQKMHITFTLDNKKGTIIEKQVTVKTVHDNYIGGEFIDIYAFEKDLGFYLRP